VTAVVKRLLLIEQCWDSATQGEVTVVVQIMLLMGQC